MGKTQEVDLDWKFIIDSDRWIDGPDAFNDKKEPRYRESFSECFSTYSSSTDEFTFQDLLNMNNLIRKSSKDPKKDTEESWKKTENKEGIKHRFGLELDVNCSLKGLEELYDQMAKYDQKELYIGLEPPKSFFTDYRHPTKLKQRINSAFPCREYGILETIKMGSSEDRTWLADEVNRIMESFYNETRNLTITYPTQNDDQKEVFICFTKKLVQTASLLERIHIFRDGNCRTCICMLIYLECKKKGIPIPLLRNPNRFDGYTQAALMLDLQTGIMIGYAIEKKEITRSHLENKKFNYNKMVKIANPLEQPAICSSSLFPEFKFTDDDALYHINVDGKHLRIKRSITDNIYIDEIKEAVDKLTLLKKYDTHYQKAEQTYIKSSVKSQRIIEPSNKKVSQIFINTLRTHIKTQNPEIFEDSNKKSQLETALEKLREEVETPNQPEVLSPPSGESRQENRKSAYFKFHRKLEKLGPTGIIALQGARKDGKIERAPIVDMLLNPCTPISQSDFDEITFAKVNGCGSIHLKNFVASDDENTNTNSYQEAIRSLSKRSHNQKYDCNPNPG